MGKGTTISVVALPILLGVAMQQYNPSQFPISRVVRNFFLGPQPELLQAKYPACSEKYLSEKVTIVVSVKDSCSQAPGFLEGLEKIAPPTVHVIYTFPNFTSCAEIDISKQLARWDKTTLLPLGIHTSPMQGWIDAVQHVKTPYTYLVHNDGYALDDYYLCELVSSLASRRNSSTTSEYQIAAPMLYESKYDGSLAAHATQSNLRLVKNEKTKEVTLRHDHSFEMALRRQGVDLVEEEQTQFLEDHGFVIDTDKIATVIDPEASFTMEYIDMIMTIRANKWKVLFVPTARLEFRITEFSWRDIPYFMYKRSEITALGTRDYLTAKWGITFPNTGFWTFIKYTIVERHAYTDLVDQSWKHQALVALGWFQMVGWNRYDIGDGSVGFLHVLEAIDGGWVPDADIPMSREKKRPEITNPRPITVSHPDEVVPYGGEAFPKIEADMKLEYFPFSAAELTTPTCSELTDDIKTVCGLIIEHGDRCSCWINLPTWKTNGILPSIIDTIAGWIKIPSRISTYWEMMVMDADVQKHTAPLEKYDAVFDNFKLIRCAVDDASCAAQFSFAADSKVLAYVGVPHNPVEVANALAKFFNTPNNKV